MFTLLKISSISPVPATVLLHVPLFNIRSMWRTNLTTHDCCFVGNLEAVAGAGAGRRQVEANKVNRRVEVTTTADKLE